jgi:tetraacyldisaccharide 4'-kinase
VEQRDVASLAGRRVGLIAGIARPASLRATLEGLGAEIVAERVFPDHHAYQKRDVEALDASVDVWVTTEKDGLKILPGWVPAGRVWVLEIEAELEGESAIVDAIERRLRAAGRLA